MIFVIGLWTFLRALFLEPAAVALENLALRHPATNCWSFSGPSPDPGSPAGIVEAFSNENRSEVSASRSGCPGWKLPCKLLSYKESVPPVISDRELS